MKMSRQKINQKPSGPESGQKKASREGQKPQLSLTSALAQISMVELVVFVGVTFGSMACLAFILFFCLPIATYLWSDKSARTA